MEVLTHYGLSPFKQKNRSSTWIATAIFHGKLQSFTQKKRSLRRLTLGALNPPKRANVLFSCKERHLNYVHPLFPAGHNVKVRQAVEFSLLKSPHSYK
jgi:hypothetical protein